MPPKRSSKVNRSISKEPQTIQKSKKQKESTSSNTNNNDNSTIQEQIYMLQNERAKLLADLDKLKKETQKIREKQRDLNFSVVQERQVEKFLEFKPAVEAWSKHTGITFTEVLYNVSEDSREWSIKGAIGEETFSMQITCKTDDILKKGYVDKFSVECSAQPQLELQTWLSSNPGNIQQILTMLKAYYDMNKDRKNGLEACRNEFKSIITVAQSESGETVVELGTDDAYYFQIKWKLVPVPKYFAKVKNHCRIACTEDGDACIKAHTDLATVKKRLNQNPIEVIQLLARSIATQNAAKDNKTRQANKSTRK